MKVNNWRFLIVIEIIHFIKQKPLKKFHKEIFLTLLGQAHEQWRNYKFRAPHKKRYSALCQTSEALFSN